MGLYAQAHRALDKTCRNSANSINNENPTKSSNLAPVVNTGAHGTSVLIVDSPNALRTACNAFGRATKPDWGAILRLGRQQGHLVEGIVAVNDGLPESVVQKFRAVGYSVHFSHARDVDDRVVSQVVRMVDRAKVFVIVSGDGGYCSLVSILRRLRKHVIVIAVEKCCHPRLRELAHEFYPLPLVGAGVFEFDSPDEQLTAMTGFRRRCLPSTDDECRYAGCLHSSHAPAVRQALDLQLGAVNNLRLADHSTERGEHSHRLAQGGR